MSAAAPTHAGLPYIGGSRTHEQTQLIVVPPLTAVESCAFLDAWVEAHAHPHANESERALLRTRAAELHDQQRLLVAVSDAWASRVPRTSWARRTVERPCSIAITSAHRLYIGRSNYLPGLLAVRAHAAIPIDTNVACYASHIFTTIELASTNVTIPTGVATQFLGRFELPGIRSRVVPLTFVGDPLCTAALINSCQGVTTTGADGVRRALASNAILVAQDEHGAAAAGAIDAPDVHAHSTVLIRTTRALAADEEIFINYGTDFFKPSNLAFCSLCNVNDASHLQEQLDMLTCDAAGCQSTVHRQCANLATPGRMPGSDDYLCGIHAVPDAARAADDARTPAQRAQRDACLPRSAGARLHAFRKMARQIVFLACIVRVRQRRVASHSSNRVWIQVRGPMPDVDKSRHSVSMACALMDECVRESEADALATFCKTHDGRFVGSHVGRDDTGRVFEFVNLAARDDTALLLRIGDYAHRSVAECRWWHELNHTTGDLMMLMRSCASETGSHAFRTATSARGNVERADEAASAAASRGSLAAEAHLDGIVDTAVGAHRDDVTFHMTQRYHHVVQSSLTPHEALCAHFIDVDTKRYAVVPTRIAFLFNHLFHPGEPSILAPDETRLVATAALGAMIESAVPASRRRVGTARARVMRASLTASVGAAMQQASAADADAAGQARLQADLAAHVEPAYAPYVPPYDGRTSHKKRNRD